MCTFYACFGELTGKGNGEMTGKSPILSKPSNADLPGTPDLQLEGETRKDESVILSCALNDAGHPRASHFVWER